MIGLKKREMGIIGGRTAVKTDGKTTDKDGTKAETTDKISIKTETDGKLFKEGNGKTDGKSIKKLTDAEHKVLDLVQDNPLITQKELASILDLSDSGIRYVMRGLKEKGLLYRTGSHRKGIWHLTK